jgi:hypothetical protein
MSLLSFLQTKKNRLKELFILDSLEDGSKFVIINTATCMVQHATNKTGSSSDDWIY